MTEGVAEAVRILRSGGLVAFPTETVYGLGADATSEAAVRRIFAAKGRPPGRALTVHLAPSADPAAWGTWDDRARRLAERFWPGPLTLIVPRLGHVPDVVTGGLDTVGLRVPSHPLCVELLEAFDGGVAAPSANRSGHVSPTRADDVRSDLGPEVDLVLDGGPCPVGVESTVLSLATPRPRLLRPGTVTVDELEALIGPIERAAGADAPRYAPRTPLSVVPDGGLAAALAEGGHMAVVSPKPPPSGTWFPAPATPDAYARELYALLRRIDAGGFDRVLAVEPPAGTSWDVVRDRLHAAAR